jgi:hypothetical protein
MKKFFLQCQKRRAYGFTYSKENAEKAVSNPTISDGETYVRILSDDVVKSNFRFAHSISQTEITTIIFLVKTAKNAVHCRFVWSLLTYLICVKTAFLILEKELLLTILPI